MGPGVIRGQGLSRGYFAARYRGKNDFHPH